MNNNNEQQNIQDNVLQKIRMNELTMRPRFYFTLKLIAFIVVAFLTTLVSIFIFSFILFSIRASSQLTLLGFGARGWYLFFLMFPWPLLFLDVVLIAVLELLLRQFRFGYKKSIVYLLLGLLVIVFALGFALDRGVHIHEGFLERADHQHLPVFGSFYKGIHRPPPHNEGICRCVVTHINGSTLTAVDDDPSGTTTEVRIMLPNTQATSSIKIGDRIFVVGQLEDGEIHAFGIRFAPQR